MAGHPPASARTQPAPGQESVWDYPRPPALERVPARLRVVLDGVTIADTVAGVRVLETSHPPNYYFPNDDILAGALLLDPGSSFCEWKGAAHYFAVQGDGPVVHRAAWSYADPSPSYRALAGMVAFYPALMDECTVDGERARPQAGGFYGGWITDAIVGPFKGEPGSQFW